MRRLTLTVLNSHDQIFVFTSEPSAAVCCRELTDNCSRSQSQSQSYIATDSRSISKSWCRAPSGAHDQIFIIVWQLRSCFCGAPSLSFVYADGPRQLSLSRIRVPWISRPYFTVSVLRLPFSSPPTTRRVTVEVFDPASTRVCSRTSFTLSYKPLIWHAGKRFNCCVTADAVTWPFPTLALSKCL
jgi:hypothetical protein